MTRIFSPSQGLSGALFRYPAYVVAMACAHAITSAAAFGKSSDVRDFADLSLEQLSNIVVTSVSKREQPLGTAAASVYVISADDIRRSGVTSLPEALRLAPNLQIARTDSNQYAISSRGFNNPIANRMLVLIDGRTVYSPLFSGVFWDVQDVMLEDVERIEVISGPGATLWGANAVNGVINVITRSAKDTQGTLATLGSGNRTTGAGARLGGEIGDNGAFRVYGKSFRRENTERAGGTPVPDSSERSQAGFRTDWGGSRRNLTVQGDAYVANIDQQVGGSRNLNGANVLARWSEQRGDGSSLRVQTYYDRAERDQPGAFHKNLDIADFEFQHGLLPAEDHNLIWGGGYRYGNDQLEDQNLAAFVFIPADKTLHWYHLFVQDEWDIRPDLALTVGIKGEHNDYSGLEWLPNVRVAYSFRPDQLVWSAISRTVRAPSRLDREFFTPGTPPYVLAGGPNFHSEVSNVYELGYRLQPADDKYSFSATAFYHQHDGLRSFDPGPGGFGGELENNIEGHTDGVEVWGSYRVTKTWKLNAGWVELRQHLHSKPGTAPVPSSALLGNDPKRWITLRSALEIGPKYEFDVTARYIGELYDPVVPAYTAVDARLGYLVTKEVQLSVLLQNLFDPSHPEWGPAVTRSEYPRGIFFELQWRS